MVDRLAQDESVYVDTKPGSEQMYQLFNSGKMGMVATGPWQLPDIIDAKVDYGVVPLPTFSGQPVTISAPDTWTVFDNGERGSKAAVEFVQWLSRRAGRAMGHQGRQPAAAQGHRRAAGVERSTRRTPRPDVFSNALDGAAREAGRIRLPADLPGVGQALVAVLLSQRTPEEALKAAVQAERGRSLPGGRLGPGRAAVAPAERAAATAPSGLAVASLPAGRRHPRARRRADGMVAAAVVPGHDLVTPAVGGTARTTTRCSMTRRSAPRSATR